MTISISNHAVARLATLGRLQEPQARAMIRSGLDTLGTLKPTQNGALRGHSTKPALKLTIGRDERGELTVITAAPGGPSCKGDRAGQHARNRARKAARERAGGMPNMSALVVTARLPAGFVSHDPWGPTLDGVLAAALMRERLGSEYALSAARPSAMTPVEGLPLERIEHGGLWWYACSAPIAPAEVTRERRYFHRRFDAGEALSRVPSAQRIQDKAGPYKSARLPLVRTLAAELRWHAVGDPDEVQRLLGGIDAIGAHRATGYGAVAEWLVEAGGDAVLARTHRPLPVGYAQSIGLDRPLALAGIRPPARLPGNTVECMVPVAA